MVRKLLSYLLSVFLLPLSLFAADASISVDTTGESYWENQPLNFNITITHDKSDSVDASSFELEGKAIKPEVVRELPFSSTSAHILSIYQLQVPGKPKGLHVLPSVKVKVGARTIQSIPISYSVQGLTQGPAGTGASLTLQTKVDGKPPFYPGQRFRLIYRYIFNDNIELTTEKLPLMDAPGFKKVGTREIKDTEEGGNSIREISQVVEALKSGSYVFPASQVEGFAYRTDLFGGRTYLKPPIKATTPEVTIVVESFPEEGKPASFNGAIGPFSGFSVSLLSSPDVGVGDKMTVRVSIRGEGKLENVPLPEMCCQPGYSGYFQLGDLPPQENVVGNEKQYIVELRPLFASITSIPSLEFSYFLPSTKGYGTLRSDPIPIKVAAPAQQPADQKKEKPADTDWKKFDNKPEALQIGANARLGIRDLHDRLLASWQVVWAIPLGVLLLILQYFFKVYFDRHKKEESVPKSEHYFKQAMTQGEGSPEFYSKMIQAFLLRLKERGLIPSADIVPDQLPENGKVGQVRALLLQVDEMRFGGKGKEAGQSMLPKLRDEFRKI